MAGPGSEACLYKRLFPCRVFLLTFSSLPLRERETRISPKTGTESELYFLFSANEAVDSVSLVQLGAVSPCPCMY